MIWEIPEYGEWSKITLSLLLLFLPVKGHKKFAFLWNIFCYKVKDVLRMDNVLP